MSEQLVADVTCPPWFDGSPGGQARLIAVVNDSNLRVTELRMEVDPGVVGTIVLAADEYVFNVVATGTGDTISRSVTGGEQVAWNLGDGGEVDPHVTRRGVQVRVSLSWVNPDGVLNTAQRTERERTRGS